MLQEWQQEEIQAVIGDFVKGNQVGYLSDSLTEMVDSYLPVYYGDIMKEWQEMPHEYDNRGSHELGAQLPINIQDLMGLDLYLYYSDLVQNYAHEYAKSAGIDLDKLG